MKEDPKKHYWGIKHGRIDVLMDELGNWHDSEDVHYTTFDIDRVPILLLRFTPYCPECLESVFKGFLNWEKDPTGEVGIAFRCYHHFWYRETQLWDGLPKKVVIPTTNVVAQIGTPAVYEESVYTKGREAFATGVSHWNNPYDGRTAEGRSWSRGWIAAKMDQELQHS